MSTSSNWLLNSRSSQVAFHVGAKWMHQESPIANRAALAKVCGQQNNNNLLLGCCTATIFSANKREVYSISQCRKIIIKLWRAMEHWICAGALMERLNMRATALTSRRLVCFVIIVSMDARCAILLRKKRRRAMEIAAHSCFGLLICDHESSRSKFKEIISW